MWGNHGVRVLTQAAGLGWASGGRSTAGLTALALSSPPQPASHQPLAALTGRRGRRLAPLLFLGELVGDKLPSTPSRLAPPVLIARLGTGGLAAYALSRRQHVAPMLPALVGSMAALAGSVVGLRWRKIAADRGWPDLPAALVEDVAVIGLAGAAAWRWVD